MVYVNTFLSCRFLGKVDYRSSWGIEPFVSIALILHSSALLPFHFRPQPSFSSENRREFLAHSIS